MMQRMAKSYREMSERELQNARDFRERAKTAPKEMTTGTDYVSRPKMDLLLGARKAKQRAEEYASIADKLDG